MSAKGSRIEPLEHHLLWIEETRPEDEETVSSFRRMVPSTSPWYRRVISSFKRLEQICTDPESGLRLDRQVADLMGDIRLADAVASVKVNRVDVF